MLNFTVKKAITLPVRKLAVDADAFLRFEGEMFEGKQIDGQDGPATLVHCTDLETGELCQIVVPSVLKGVLEDSFGENDSYVGRNFKLHKGKKPSGKRYHPYTLVEIELPDEQAEEAPAADKKAAKK